MRFAHFLSKICFGSRFRVTGMSYPVFIENEEKRILHPKRCFSNTFSETVMTSAVLTENEGGAKNRQILLRRWTNHPVK